MEIQHKKARTPQAKGRIERLWGTLQERLLLEMRLAGVSTLEEANAFLPAYIERHNARFAEAPREAVPVYRPKVPPSKLPEIIGFQHERKAGRDSTISYVNQTYSLENKKLRAGATVLVLVDLDGTLRATYEGKRYDLVSWQAPEQPEKPRPTTFSPTPEPEPYRPPATHPWKKASYDSRVRKEARLAAVGENGT